MRVLTDSFSLFCAKSLNVAKAIIRILQMLKIRYLDYKVKLVTVHSNFKAIISHEQSVSKENNTYCHSLSWLFPSSKERVARGLCSSILVLSNVGRTS